MLANYSSKIALTIGLSLWVVIALVAGQLAAEIIVRSIDLPLNQSVEVTILAAIGYVLGLAAVLGLPVLFKRRINLEVIGLSRLPSYRTIGLGVAAMIPYFILSNILIVIATSGLKIIDPSVGQDIGFTNLTLQVEYVVAFLTLVVLAPLAEELLFRGYFLGTLRTRINPWLAVFITAVVFGSLHLLGAGENDKLVFQWAAAIDTFALGLVAGTLRNATGTIWAGVVLHALKNLLAFYVLFISPLSTGGM